MARKGLVQSVISADYSYKVKNDTITLYRYSVVVKLTDKSTVEGKIDSQDAPPGPVKGWTVGSIVDFDTEVKTMKNSETYNKFKKPPKENFGGGGGRKPMSAEVKAQIIRNVSMQCAIWLHGAEVGLDQTISGLSGQVYVFIMKTIPLYTTETIDADQASMGVQGAMKVASSGAKQLNVVNADMFFNQIAPAVIKYIMHG